MTESTSKRIYTNRLELVAATLSHVRVELETPEQLGKLLNTQTESEWPPGEYDREAQLFFKDKLEEGGTDVIGWYGWYALLRCNMKVPSTLIGAGGYFGPPDIKGEVEIGFSILSRWQRIGLATEMAIALVQNAYFDRRVKKVIAHTHPSNLASRKVLEKSGFVFINLDEVSGNYRFESYRNTELQTKI